VTVLIAPSANSNGARSRSAPPQSVAIQLTSRTPIGTVSPIAAPIAASSQPSGIGAVYMFCIQASNPRTPVAASAAATPRWLNSGLPENTAAISEIAPKAGSSITR
jgi:hypothetical protein